MLELIDTSLSIVALIVMAALFILWLFAIMSPPDPSFTDEDDDE